MFRNILVSLMLLLGSAQCLAMETKKQAQEQVESKKRFVHPTEEDQPAKKQKIDVSAESKRVIVVKADKEQQLFVAIIENADLEEVKALIKAGVNVNAKMSSGDTPLMVALNGGEEAIALELLKAGANKDMAGEGGITPLMLAVTKGLRKVARPLVFQDRRNKKEHALLRINPQDKDGNTALMRAVKNRDWKMAALLLNAGADVSLKNKPVALTPAGAGKPEKPGRPVQDVFDIAQQVKFKEFPALMERYERAHAFMDALRHKKKQEARALFEQGIDVYAEDYIGSPLTWAAGEGLLDLIDPLVAQGADLNFPVGLYGETPLTRAVFAENIDAVKLLLARGANINQSRSDGQTPLMIAVLQKNISLVEILLAAGADVTLKNKRGEMALNLVSNCDGKCVEIRRMLEEKAKQAVGSGSGSAGSVASMDLSEA